MLVTLLAQAKSQTQAYLDGNNVKALILNRNDMFWDVTGNGSAKYEVPKNSGKNCNFASSLWIGGLDAGNQLHFAGMTYRQNGVDFWPGPLDTLTGNTTQSISTSFNRVWKINQSDINALITNSTTTADILSWPANGNMAAGYSIKLAPYADVNGDGVYDPNNGEYPIIKGDQMIYYVVNDKLGLHGETGGLPLGVEMQVSAYVYNCPAVLSAYPVLNNTTFYNYKIINRSNTQYNNVYISVWSDVDLGNYNDDHIGCDPSLNIGYAYNANPTDPAYGAHPPILSYQMLRGPIADPNDGIDNDRDGMIDEPGEQAIFNNFMFYNNNIGSQVPATTNPTVTNDYYNFVQSTWKNGLPLRADSAGYIVSSTVSTTPYAYPGNPQTNVGWTEFTRNNPAGDRRFIISNGPFTLKPNAVVEIDYSILTTFDSTAGGYKNVAKMKTENASINTFFNLANKPNCQSTIGIKKNEVLPNTVSVWPNPANDVLFVSSDIPLSATASIINGIGQTLHSEKMNGTSAKINLKDLPAGVYLLEIKSDDTRTLKKFVKN